LYGRAGDSPAELVRLLSTLVGEIGMFSAEDGMAS
jgi:hypothetical protein